MIMLKTNEISTISRRLRKGSSRTPWRPTGAHVDRPPDPWTHVDQPVLSRTAHPKYPKNSGGARELKLMIIVIMVIIAEKCDVFYYHEKTAP